MTSRPSAFDQFAADGGERLRRALVARYGVEDGSERTAEALSYAWEHWDRISQLDNPVGYLYRVAQSGARRHRRWGRPSPYPPERPTEVDAPTDPELGRCLAKLNPTQRTCVVLVHVFGWTYGDVAEILDCTVGSVRNHVHRGVRNLRVLLEGS